MTDRELNACLKQLHTYKAKKDELQRDIDRCHDALKGHLAAIGADELTQGGYVISNKVVVSSALDAKALRAELPDVAARYTMTKEGRRFFVRAVV